MCNFADKDRRPLALTLIIVRFAFIALAVSGLMSLQGCYPKITPMMKKWPISYAQYPRVAPKPVEAIYLATESDTIEGYTRMVANDVFPIIPKGVEWSRANVKYIPVNLVTFMRLYSYDFDSHFNEFRKISNGYLYRVAAEKGKIEICDDILQFDGSWRNKTLLIEPKVTTQLFSWFAFCVHLGNKRPLLLKFINRRYHVRLQERDFKSKEDMLQYILKKES